jgi:hypothetical protein
MIVRDEYITGETIEPCDDYGINAYFAGEDSRYPILVIQGQFGSRGYSVCTITGSLKRLCICAAHRPSECCCCAWDEFDEWM